MPAILRYATNASMSLLAVLLLAACGGGSVETAQSLDTASGSHAASSASVASGAHRLRLQIGDQTHELNSDSARFWRGPVYGVEGVETVELELMDADNTVYAKADLYLSPGAAVEGEYALGHIGRPEVRNQPGRGQVISAIERGDEREMRVSGDGSLNISREGGVLLARFQYRINAFTGEPLDQPVSGEMRIRESHVGE